MSVHAERVEAYLRDRNASYPKGDVIDLYYKFDSFEDVASRPPRELRESDLRALLAENARLRMQNDELSSENHVLRHGPTMSAEEWEA